MGYVKWSYDTLNTFCHDVFRKFGFNEEQTNIIKDVLLTADLYGIESHGMQRMVRYDKGIEKGTIHPDAKPTPVFFAFSIAFSIAKWEINCPIPSCPSITADTGVSNTTSGFASGWMVPFSIPLSYLTILCIP